MKITSFNPLIVTKDVASVSALFEALGFERKHNPTGTMAVRRRKTLKQWVYWPRQVLSMILPGFSYCEAYETKRLTFWNTPLTVMKEKP